jgi:hypothetical protein
MSASQLDEYSGLQKGWKTLPVGSSSQGPALKLSQHPFAQGEPCSISATIASKTLIQNAET